MSSFSVSRIQHILRDPPPRGTGKTEVPVKKRKEEDDVCLNGGTSRSLSGPTVTWMKDVLIRRKSLGAPSERVEEVPKGVDSGGVQKWSVIRI